MSVALRIPGRHGHAVEYSPYYGHRVACASAQYYGVVGCGTLFIIDLTNKGPVVASQHDWNDSLFDVTWSERNENVCVTGSGDGTIQVWDINQNRGPLKCFSEHSKEVYSVDWSQTRDNHQVVSGSWDKSIKLWDINNNTSIATYSGHEHVVYSTIWSPRVAGCFASASGDNTTRIWDTRKSYMAQLVCAHPAEVLSCDWSKYDEYLLMSGATDNIIRGWDLRNHRKPVFELNGHKYAIRRLKCSPFNGGVLMSCSYDFTIRLWNFTTDNPLIETLDHHTEFTCGLDFNLHHPGQIVDCGWDETVVFSNPKSLAP